jgi:F0F1-type ATP synthase assembly protein I
MAEGAIEPGSVPGGRHRFHRLLEGGHRAPATSERYFAVLDAADRLCETDHKMRKRRSNSQPSKGELTSGWVASGAFLGSILSGALLGYLADRWLGTEPWLVVIGIIVGSYSGFMTMWKYSKHMEDVPRER